MKNDFMHDEINKRVNESFDFNDISQRIDFKAKRRKRFKIKMNFLKLSNAFVILFIAICSIFVFSEKKSFPHNQNNENNSSSNINNSNVNTSSNNNNESHSSSLTSYGQHFLILSIPQEINFRNISYKSASENELEIKNYELDTILAYLINKEDYEEFYKDDPNLEYCLEENNSIYYANGIPKFPIYSLVNYSFEKVIAIYVDGVGSLIYVNKAAF